MDGLAETQSLSLRREQEGRMDRDVEGWPEGQFWVCCVTLGELPNLSEPVSSCGKLIIESKSVLEATLLMLHNLQVSFKF